MYFSSSFDHNLAGYLAKAIKHKCLHLYTQPQIDLLTKQKVSAEVFLRVPYSFSPSNLPSSSKFSENLLNISTNEWIQIATNNNLMTPLTHWIIEKVIHYLSTYKNNENFCFYINIPPTLINNNLITFITRHLNKHNVNPRLLGIEITEIEKPFNICELNESIQKIRALNIPVVIDDFGIGYANIEYLIYLDIDAVKIDQSFLYKAKNDKKSLFILSSFVKIIREVGLSVICEGIESVDEMKLAQEIGCNIGQGFFIQQPAPLSL